MSKNNPITISNLEFIARYKDVDSKLFSKYVKEINKQVLEVLGDTSISVIFVKNDYIQELNKTYRKKDEPTDVLSFNLENDYNEIYISPAYIYQSYRRGIFVEELLRMIIHGILHIYGYDHEGKFDGENIEEKMFKVQEDILNKVLKRN